MSQKIKKIKDPGRFLLDKGLLFEINRKVLHPLGLAIEFDVDDNGKAKFSGIWDFMDDPEGIIYDKEVLEDGVEKYNKFMEEHGNERIKTREEKLGYVIQDLVKKDYCSGQILNEEQLSKDLDEIELVSVEKDV